MIWTLLILLPQDALLYVFEDNEAVVKMIVKGRSPMMRHVSRTHGVALDWLFGRINWDRKNQIKYVDTKNQLADMLTKGSFTRDEWSNLHGGPSTAYAKCMRKWHNMRSGAWTLCRILRKSTDSCDGSPHQSVEWELSHYRMFVRNATVSP